MDPLELDESPDIDEIRDTRLSEAVRVRNAMPALMNHDGWKLLCEALQEELMYMQQQIMSPALSEEDVRCVEGIKGEYRTIKRLLETPQHMLDDAQIVVDAFMKDESDVA